MKKNDIIETEITGMTDDGSGVGHADSRAVFIPYTVVGERVRAVVVKVLKNYAYAKLLDVVRPSVARLKSECEYFYKCGGCSLWHMNNKAELDYKRQKVTDCLQRIGGLDAEAEEVLQPSDRVRYRNKAQFPVTPSGIGFYRQNSHDVIPICDCIIQNEENTKVISAIKSWMEKYSVSAYDEKTDSGCIRHVYTRCGKSGMLITIVTRADELPHKSELIEALKNSGIRLAGVVQNINSRRTNVVLGSKNITLWGDGYLIDTIGSIKFKISPLSFYQVNPKATLLLYKTAAEMAGLSGKELLWDLYCGIGTIGLFMADKVKKVVGVEVIPEAIENAKENAALNDIRNAEFYCGKAEELAEGLYNKYGKPDVVILDPPRKGCDEELLKTVAKAKPKKIVYVSCKPATLARDLKYICANGYEAVRVVPINMFPATSHVESVCLLSKL